MVFSSSLFLVYFLPLFLIVYFISPVKIKNFIILLFSIFFYSWGAPIFIFVVLGSAVVNYYLVEQIHKAINIRKKNTFLTLSIILNIGLLGYFKYANFFIENVNLFLTNTGLRNIHWIHVALPIGISFFTFQSLTYTIDVYRNISKPLKKVTDYILYILLFPQLIAGPIVRFNSIADQIEDRKYNETLNNKINGFIRFIIGLSKKVLIANVMGNYVEQIYSLPLENLDTGLAWIGTIAYSFQIYFDFSGYSDMAIGIGKMIGFDFPENFNAPYISRNITEFWKRWHMTLSTWMRDYLYIPLGGNRASKGRLYFNLWIVFLISGLWHGAAWNFIIWGIFHGIFLVIDRLFMIKFSDKIGKIPAILLTYLIVLFSWVFFRADTIEKAFGIIKTMLTVNFNKNVLYYNREFIFILILAAFFSFIPATGFGNKIMNKIFNFDYNNFTQLIIVILMVVFYILCVGSISSSGFNPFIYFRF